MSTTGDLPKLPAHADGDEVAGFDELARRAGAALRRPAPPDGLRVIAARQRRQRARKASVVGGAVVATLIGALVVASSRDDTDPFPPAESSPATVGPTSPATTAPVDSSPVTTSPPTASPSVIEPTPVSTPQLFAQLAPDSIAELPDAPISGRNGGAAVWTGTEMIVWGGSVYDPVTDSTIFLADGAAFNLADGTWRLLATGPLSGRAGPAAVWTGTEMIVWAGFIGDDTRAHDGAAYNPTTDTWRMLAPLPFSTGDGTTVWSMVWTGTDVVASFGDVTAAYDPVTDSWRHLSYGTGGGPGIWTGDSIIWNRSDSLTRYDVAADRWSVIAGSYAALVGVPAADGVMSSFVALPAAPGAPVRILDKDLEPVGELPAFPGDPRLSDGTLGATGQLVGDEIIFAIYLVHGFSREPDPLWALNPTTQTWRRLDPAVPAGLVVAGDVMLAWGEVNGPVEETFGVAYRSRSTRADS